MPPSSDNGSIRNHHNVVCPFCALLCDDLVVQSRDLKTSVEKHGCKIAIKRFRRARSYVDPLIKGQPASLDDAIDASAKILKRAKLPLISGLGTDVEGIRAAVSLTEKSAGILDHMHREGMQANLSVLQSRGWITTTLSEVRNRADLIVLVGLDIANNHPRFAERVIEPNRVLNAERRKGRQVLTLGQSKLPTLGSGLKVTHYRCDGSDIANVLNSVRAVITGVSLQAQKIGGLSIKRINALAESLSAAQYPVLVWSPGQLPIDHAELAIDAICALVELLNLKGRAAGLTIGGDDGGMTALSTCSWLTGYPLRVSFAGDLIDYDPVRLETRRLIADKAVDALLWLSAFNPHPAPTADDLPTITLTTPDSKPRPQDSVFIPVGTPGIDHAGQLVRTDNVVSLPLSQLIKSDLPSAADVMRAITERL